MRPAGGIAPPEPDVERAGRCGGQVGGKIAVYHSRKLTPKPANRRTGEDTVKVKAPGYNPLSIAAKVADLPGEERRRAAVSLPWPPPEPG